LTCNACHNGGTAPTVELTGPTTLPVGETGQYTLIIRGGAAGVGGMNVATSSGGAALEPGSGQKKLGSEITHTTPKAFSGNELRFDFRMRAPPSAGTVTLFGAGNSANGSGSEAGDMAGTATLPVTVTASGGTDGGTDGEPDAGTGNGGGDGGGDEDSGGCAATGGAPFLLFSLLAAGMMRRRRA
jgi:uncharacterized protein (TIGR03382 family)